MLLGVAATSLAQSPEESPEQLWTDAVAAEADADPVGARRAYLQLRDAAPGTRLARRAEARIDWIDRRMDGPLAEVMRARANPNDPRALERLEAALHDAAPSLIVREGWALLARARERSGDSRGAALAYRRWLELATGDERERAASGLAHLLERTGDPAGADRVLERAGSAESANEIRAARLKRTARLASACILGLHVVLLFAMARRLEQRWRALVRPSTVVLLAVLMVPMILAGAYDPASRDSFVWLLVTSLPLVALAILAGATESESKTKRGVLAASAFIAQLALGVLVYTR